jgi:hypothetical protein
MQTAKFSYPDEFREPAPERAYIGQTVTILRTFDDPATAKEMRAEYGECLMYVQAADGHIFTAFETELEPI